MMMKNLLGDYRGLTKDGEMVYGWYVKTHNSDGNNTHWIIKDGLYVTDILIGINPKFPKQLQGCYEVIPETVGRRVGLKDKNGKEIYEGDKVRIYNHKCQLQLFEAIGRVTERYSAWGVTDLKIIKFEKYSPGIKPPDVIDILYFLNIFSCKHIEIIGNIHQPELKEK